jgi:MFS family permease
MAFDMPTRQAFVKDMATPRDLMNAIALNSTIFNLARIFGPALAGQMIKMNDIRLPNFFGALFSKHMTIHFGIPGALYANAASFLAVIAGLFLIRYRRVPTPPSDANLWQHLGEGFRYAIHERTIRLLLLVISVLSIFGFSYAVLMPVIAIHILGLDAGGYGWLMGAAGAGAFIGAVLLASTAGKLRKGRFLFWGCLISAFGLMAFGLSHHYWLSLVLLLFVGGGLVVASACVNSMIQEIVPDYLRGRVVSIYALVFAGFSPIGAVYAGLTATVASSPGFSICLGGVFCLLMLIVLTVKSRWLWNVI